MITQVLAKYIAAAPDKDLPMEVKEKTTLHIIDTVAAIVSGARLNAGRRILPFVEKLAGTPESMIFGSGQLTTAALAALANGMCAHADETDDSHAPSLTHPGCAVVPAAFAVAERERWSGKKLLRAVALGYDIGTRITIALGADRFHDLGHSSHSFGGLFGATAASAAGLTETQAAGALAYAVQLASGNTCWRRDPEHVEKAFDFGGMPAHNGVLAASFAAAGFSASVEPLDGNPGLFAAFPQYAKSEQAVELLGERFEIMRTAIKKWCVGSPIQAALDSLEFLMSEHKILASDVVAITVALPRHSAPVVDNREMPDVNLQHQLALMLQDGAVTFESSHDRSRMQQASIVALRNRISIEPRSDKTFTDNPRQAWLSIKLVSGHRLEHRTLYVRGTPNNPMTPEEVIAKCRDLMAPILSGHRAERAIAMLLSLDDLDDIKALRTVITPLEFQPSQ